MTKQTKVVTRILIADDHPVVRQGIRTYLSKHEEFEVVGEASDGADAIEKALALRPDVVLMDVTMPIMNGMEAMKALRKQLPEAKLLALSVHEQQLVLLQIIRSGAHGYVPKHTDLSEVTAAIQAVQRGDLYFNTDAARAVLDQHMGSAQDNALELSQREREVLVMIVDGRSNKQIATSLGIGVRTIETHRERIMDKLRIRSVAGLTKFAIANGLTRI